MIDIYEEPIREEWGELAKRGESGSEAQDELLETVGSILDRVKAHGDSAIVNMAMYYDKVDLHQIQVTKQEIEQAHSQVSDELKEAIEIAAANIEQFHSAQKFEELRVEICTGVTCYQRAMPIERVGLYIPGGSAPLFSTVLMLAIPAKIAGCSQIAICTPTRPDGTVAPEVLYAADRCGVSEIHKVGGAQAIAAMAYGTNSIAKVDKVFGPGNRYVTQAKQMLGGRIVAIDMPAGPSEVMILADETARIDFIAADMLAQIEHGPDSQAIAVCQSFVFARKIDIEVAKQLTWLSRADTIRQALKNCKIVVIEDLEMMYDFANFYAAEHLIVMSPSLTKHIDKIKAAGSVFIGAFAPESAGDYASGTNHTLPTSGWARSMSGVNLDSFIHKITYQNITRAGLATLAPTICTMAQAEGLTAHKAAVEVRFTEKQR